LDVADFVAPETQFVQILQPRQRREVSDLVAVEVQIGGGAFLGLANLGQCFETAVEIGAGKPLGPLVWMAAVRTLLG
jgi:hypothetical protein